MYLNEKKKFLKFLEISENNKKNDKIKKCNYKNGFLKSCSREFHNPTPPSPPPGICVYIQ